MNLSIKKMSPLLAEDYFDFFDNRAFSDNSPFYPCYCNAFQMTKEQIADVFKEGGGNSEQTEGVRIALRNSAMRMVEQNMIQGYLAYDGEVSIGWCNANDKRNYIRVGEFDLDDVSGHEDYIPLQQEEKAEKIKSVVCFEIAPEYRGKGIATALLNRVCEDAKNEGYVKVEVYPVLRDAYEKLDFTGPVHLYEKAGFVCILQQGKMLVMQKDL